MDDEPRGPFADAAARRRALAGKTIGNELSAFDPDLNDLPTNCACRPQALSSVDALNQTPRVGTAGADTSASIGSGVGGSIASRR